MNLRNVHDTNLATALELGRRLGLHVPAEEETFIFAVEIADNATFSTRLSPEVEAAYPTLAAEVLAEIEALVAAGQAESGQAGCGE
jgi:Ni,Fe-hydrogenase maturation factor